MLVLARQSSRSREERALACSLVRSNGRTEEELSLLLDLIGRKEERAYSFLVGRSCRHRAMSVIMVFVPSLDWKDEVDRRTSSLPLACSSINQSNREDGESVHSLVRSITEGRARLFLVGRSCRHRLMSIVTWFVLCPFDWKNELARSL